MFHVADFPAIKSSVEDGINRRLHTGVQIYVSIDGKTVLDSAFGEAAPGRLMTPSTIMPWRSAGKPLTALLILKQMEMGRLSLTTTLADLLPDAAETDKDDVTMLDLLTHQSGFPQTDAGWPHAEWSTSVHRALHEPRQLEVGTAAYHPQSSWFVLGEILRHLDSSGAEVAFSDLLSRDLLEPLQLWETQCGVSLDRLHSQPERFPILYERDMGQLKESTYSSSPWLTAASPGGNLRGPIRELGQFYEMLLRGGTLTSGDSLVSVSTIRQMTARHRVGQYDQTLQHVIDFGLGIICNSNRHGFESVPYGFGRFCSEMTFGHGGSQCSMGFCDPDRRLVVAWSSNGFCGEGQHQRRNRLINEAVYADLGLN